MRIVKTLLVADIFQNNTHQKYLKCGVKIDLDQQVCINLDNSELFVGGAGFKYQLYDPASNLENMDATII